MIGAAIVDVICHQGLRARHGRPRNARYYADRSGLPRGIEASRGLARQDFEIPSDMRATLAAG